MPPSEKLVAIVAAVPSVSLLPPSLTEPAPVSALTVVPPLVSPEMSKIALSARPLLLAIVPAPASASVPALIVVAPV